MAAVGFARLVCLRLRFRVALPPWNARPQQQDNNRSEDPSTSP